MFGQINAKGMEVVDSLYAGYGECAELCGAPDPFTNATDPYCHGTGAACKGVNISQLVAKGDPYLEQHNPLLTKVTAVRLNAL